MKIGILISGRGSNLQALAAACADPDFPAEIAIVISNRPKAAGLAFAREAGLKAVAIDHKDYSARETFDAELDATLTEAGVELVVNAGFLRILGDEFVGKWRNRIINIHPSLLPAFKGLNVHERVLESGVRITGCTVHFVRPEMDEGPIIAQAAVPVLPDDTVESLGARVLAAEHKLYPYAVGLVAAGRTRIVEERVLIDGAAFDNQAPLFSPDVG